MNRKGPGEEHFGRSAIDCISPFTSKGVKHDDKARTRESQSMEREEEPGGRESPLHLD